MILLSIYYIVLNIQIKNRKLKDVYDSGGYECGS